MSLKKIICLGVSVLVLTMAASVSAYATNGIKLIGYGPVQRAMGGASTALPLDSATVITNPAGMTELDKRVDLGLTIAVPYTKYRAHSDAGLVTMDNGNVSSTTPPFILPDFGIVLPFKDIIPGHHIGLGVGVYGTSGVGTNYESNLYRNVTFVKYTNLKVAPALSYSYKNMFSIGAAPNFNYATLGYEAAVAATNPAHNEDSSFGFGYTLGLLVKPLTFFDIELPFGLPNDFLSFGASYESKQTFQYFEYSTSGGKDKMVFDLPQTLNFGLGIKPTDRFRMAFDLSWIDWAQTLGQDKPMYREKESTSAFWNANWRSQWVYKLGFEYDVIKDWVVNKLTLRAGYNYGQNPLKKDRPFEDIALPAFAEHHITCGAQIDFTKNLGVNASFVWAPPVDFHPANSADYIDSATLTTSVVTISAGLVYKF